MFKKDTRRGLALGAAFSLIASLFVAAPAAQADEASTVIAPFTGTSNTMLITEEFVLKTRLGTGVDASKINNLKYFIEKPAGLNLSVSNTVSSTIVQGTTFPANGETTVSAIAAATTNSYVTPVSPSTTNINQLRLQLWSASAITSLSAAVTVKVTAFLDVDPNNKFDSATEPYSTYEVTFVPWSALAASATLDTPIKDAVTVKATAAVSGVNFEQLNGNFKLQFKNTYESSETTTSATLNDYIASGAMSASADVSASAPVDSSVSATLFYDADANGTYAAGEALVVSKKGVAVATIDDVTVSAVAGDNLVGTGAGTADARVNSEFTLKAWAYTGSTVVAAKVPTFTVTTSTDVLSDTNYIVVNGVKYTDSSKIAGKKLALTAGTDGKGTITISTFGFDGTTDTVTVDVAADNDTETFTVTQKTVTYSVSRTAGNYFVTTPGATVTADFAVKDQFGVASPLSDQQIVFSVAGTGFSSSTQIVAVVAGKATAVVTPAPATKTGSYTITPNLQYKNRAGQWVDDTANETAVTVYVQSSVANSFSTKPVASLSASISYGVALSWSAAITANVAVTGSDVVVSAPGVLFQYDSKTYSDTVTMTAGSSGAVSFKATSTKAGKYTISFVAGTATASTVLTIDPAAHSAGKTLTFDKTSIVAGQTSTITGTLVDANGNPVETGTTASIAVKWTGLGLPFNLPAAVDTDEDGQFSFQVLVLSTEVGEAAISATYQPASSATDTKNLTFVQKIDVVKAGAVATADQKLTIGTFNGYIAIYAKGYTGQKLSYKVAGKWGVVESLSAFQRVVRKTGAGYEIAVVLYIDGVEVKTETVTTK